MIRIFISPTRSGSGAFLRCFENNPAVTKVFHQPIKSGYRQDGEFDYTFFDLAATIGDDIFVAKETIGGFQVPETQFSPLPEAGPHVTIGSWSLDRQQVVGLEPLILMRDPLQTWGSIERLNRASLGLSPFHSPFDFFVTSYKAVAAFALASRTEDLPVWCVTQELLATDIRAVLKRVCERWSIPWHPSMVEWTQEYGVRTWFSEEAQYRMDNDFRFQQSKAALAASHRWQYRESPTDDVSPEDREIIESDLRPLYAKFCALAEADFG